MNPYVKLAAAALVGGLLIWSHGFAFKQGGLEARKEVAEQHADELRAYQEFAADQLRRSQWMEKALLIVLNTPKAAPEVRTIVRENPSNCVLPDAVHDKLHESRSEANAAIRSSLGPH